MEHLLQAATPRSNWHLRIWINGEGRDFRICLKTTDIEEARERATKEALRIHGLIEGGQKVLGAPLQRLLTEFNDEQKLQVSLGNLREATRNQQDRQIQRGLRFLRSDSPADKNITENRLNAIDGNLFQKYLTHRKAEALAAGGSITATVVQQELQTIRKMFIFGKTRKLCSEAQIPVWNFDIERETAKRERVDLNEWLKTIAILKQWAPADLSMTSGYGYLSSAKATEDDKRKAYMRKLVQCAFMVMSYTGMRTGECLQLCNRDLKVVKANNKVTGVIRAETSKTGAKSGDRGFTLHKSPYGAAGNVSGINYLIMWLAHWQRHKKPDDYVFSSFADGSKRIDAIGFREHGDLYQQLTDASVGHMTPYHGRHRFITWLKERGIDDTTIGKVCGTSARMIAATYYHIDTQKAADFLTREVFEYDEDGSHVPENMPIKAG